MTSQLKTNITPDTSAIVDGQPIDADDVTTPIDDLRDQARSGQLSVSDNDTHVKHLEDALTAASPLLITKTNSGGDETLEISLASTPGTGTVTSVELDLPALHNNGTANPITSTGKIYLGAVNEAGVRISPDATDPYGESNGTNTLYIHPVGSALITLSAGGIPTAFMFPKQTIDTSGLTGNRMYDVFMYRQFTPSPAVAFEVVQWTSSTTRAEAVEWSTGGQIVKSSDTSRRYIGSFYKGVANVKYNDAERGIWNLYNRGGASLAYKETVNTWTISNGLWRAWNGNPNASFKFVCGIVDDVIQARAVLAIGSIYSACGIGLNRSNANDANGSVGSTDGPSISDLVARPREGLNTVHALEYGASGGAIGFGSGGTTYSNSYLSGVWKA